MPSSTTSHQTTTTATTATHPDTSKLTVEKNGLYILLSASTDIVPDKPNHHWALFLATTPTTGIFFHQVRSDTKWRLAIEPKRLADCRGVVAVLKLGVVEDTSDEWIQRMKECVREARVESGSELTCRTWALAALYELASEGFIGMIADWGRIRHIELEAKCLAQDVGVNGERGVVVVRSKWSML